MTGWDTSCGTQSTQSISQTPGPMHTCSMQGDVVLRAHRLLLERQRLKDQDYDLGCVNCELQQHLESGVGMRAGVSYTSHCGHSRSGQSVCSCARPTREGETRGAEADFEEAEAALAELDSSSMPAAHAHGWKSVGSRFGWSTK